MNAETGVLTKKETLEQVFSNEFCEKSLVAASESVEEV